MKRARSIKMMFRAKIIWQGEYTCPACKRTIAEVDLPDNVTRFKCFNCKTELIVSGTQKLNLDGTKW